MIVLRDLPAKLGRRAKRLADVPGEWATRFRAVRAAAAARREPRTPKLAVFVSDRPVVREAKLAFALKSIGWKTVLLHRLDPDFEAKRYFDETERYRHPWEALLMAAKHRPEVFHVFAAWDFDTAAALIAHPPGPVVFDDYDVVRGMIRPEALSRYQQRKARKETFCLKRAGGLVCRNLDTQALKRSGVELARPRIFFPEYCWDRHDLKARGTRAEGKGLHVAYGGCIAAECREPARLHYDFYAVAKELANAEIHFHLYPTPAAWRENRQVWAKYRELESATPFFHFHSPLSPEDFIRELARYDLGLINAPRDFPETGDPTSFPHRSRYELTNKLFDYLDAGLPAVVSGRPLWEFVLRRVGAAIPADWEAMVGVLRALTPADLSSLGERAAKGRRTYSVRRQAPRLEAFYRKVSESAARAAAR